MQQDNDTTVNTQVRIEAVCEEEWAKIPPSRYVGLIKLLVLKSVTPGTESKGSQS